MTRVEELANQVASIGQTYSFDHHRQTLADPDAGSDLVVVQRWTNAEKLYCWLWYHYDGSGIASMQAALNAIFADAKPYQSPKVWTGEEVNHLLTKWGCNEMTAIDVCDAINAANGLEPQPDPREELRKQIVRTDHGEWLTVLELCGNSVIVTCEPANNEKEWYWALAGDGRFEADMPLKEEAIQSAENGLIDQVIKG